MKKIILLLMILLVIPTVKAKEEIIRKYRYYEIIKEEGPYDKKPTQDYPLIDHSDYIYQDYTETDEMPPEEEGREIEKVTYYKYKRTKDISYLKIQNKSDDFNIYSIEIYYDNMPVEYTCEFKNSSLNEIKQNGYIIFNFGKEIDQMRLKVKIKANSPGAMLILTTGDNVCEQTRYTDMLSNTFEWEGTNATYYAFADWVIDTYPYKLNTSRVAISEGIVEKYKYRDKLYKTYREIKNYSDDYLLNPKYPYMIKDENDYIEEIIKTNNQNSKNDKKSNKTDNKHIEISKEVIIVPNTGL